MVGLSRSDDARGLAEFVDQLPLVDHHVHGPFREEGDEARFANALIEGNPTPLTRIDDAYATQLGFAVRRWCAELLDLPRHVSPADYGARRAELGEHEVGARFTRGAGVSDWLVDSGFGGAELWEPAGLAALSGGRAYEVVRLESLAESVITGLDDPADYADAFAAELTRLAGSDVVVGAKTILAYRIGFDVDLSRPPGAEVAEAARRWADVPGPLRDRPLIAYGIHTALGLGLPLQVHVGFGDRDLTLHRVNPSYLTDFLRTPAAAQAPIMLLHCYPYEREAGYLASAFDNVHLDVGLAVLHLGARSSEVVARGLELAPFTKILYSSDASGPAETHYLGARLWREGMTRVLSGFVAAGDWSVEDARSVVRLVGRDNARRVYGLG